MGRYIDGLSFSPNHENAIYPSFISNKDSVYFYSIFEDYIAYFFNLFNFCHIFLKDYLICKLFRTFYFH